MHLRDANQMIHSNTHYWHNVAGPALCLCLFSVGSDGMGWDRSGGGQLVRCNPFPEAQQQIIRFVSNLFIILLWLHFCLVSFEILHESIWLIITNSRAEREACLTCPAPLPRRGGGNCAFFFFFFLNFG